MYLCSWSPWRPSAAPETPHTPLEALLAQVLAEADHQQEPPEMCYTSRAIRHEQVVRLRVTQSLEIWLCQSETCT
jgi:hypothetical protein